MKKYVLDTFLKRVVLMTTHLKDRILAEMKSDYSNSLEKNFDLAKSMLRVTAEGKTEVLLKEKRSGKEQIQLYLIGKLYAKEGGIISTSKTESDELLKELGILRGSLDPWLKSLYDENKIKKERIGNKVVYEIPINMIERTLKSIEKNDDNKKSK